MKMNVIILLGILLAVGVCVMACGNKPVDNKKQNISTEPAENQFDAKVLEINEEYIMVEAAEGQDIVGEVRVQIGLISKDEMPKLEKDDTVRITHDGKMTMSLPTQMTAVEIIVQ